MLLVLARHERKARARVRKFRAEHDAARSASSRAFYYGRYVEAMEVARALRGPREIHRAQRRRT